MANYIERMLGMEFTTMDEAKGYFMGLARRAPDDEEKKQIASRIRTKKKEEEVITLPIDTSEFQKHLEAIHNSLTALEEMRRNGTLVRVK